MTHEFVLPQETHVGHVHLRVRDLDAALRFYRDGLGFREVKRESATVFLSATGSAPYHLALTGKPDATPRPRRAPGLFHVAIRYPDRRALARALSHLAQARWPIGGASDHLVSEAIYLGDAEGNGIELYADRPREQWPRDDGQIAMATEPLDLEDLLAQIAHDREPWTGIDPRTDIGHVHLQVSELARAERFYHDLIGLNITQRSYPGALFFSAGGYHHHLGANIWNSRGAGPAPEAAAGLVSWSLYVPSGDASDDASGDASGNAWRALVARLQSAGQELQARSYGSDEATASVLVHDADGIALELQTARDAVDPDMLAEIAQAKS